MIVVQVQFLIEGIGVAEGRVLDDLRFVFLLVDYLYHIALRIVSPLRLVSLVLWNVERRNARRKHLILVSWVPVVRCPQILHLLNDVATVTIIHISVVIIPPCSRLHKVMRIHQILLLLLLADLNEILLLRLVNVES